MPYITFGRWYRETTEASGHKPKYSKYDKLTDLYKGKPIHESRTLDQFYYQSADVTDRNADQVVTKALLDKEAIKSAESLPILTVDQLWLWVIDEGGSSLAFFLQVGSIR
jgi:hypothetical protein